MYIACGPGMDFQQLVEQVTITGDPTTMDLDPFAMPTGTVIAQGKDEGKVAYHLDEIFADAFEGLAPCTEHSVDKVTSGERVTDFMTVLHRYILVETSSVGLTGSAVIIDEKNDDKVYNILRNWALFRKGSKLYKVLKNTQSTSSGDGLIEAVNLTCEGVIITDNFTLNNPEGRQGIILEDTHYKPSLEFKLPYYNTQAFVVNEELKITTDEGMKNYAGLFFTPYLTGGPQLSVKIYMALADDFSFGWMTGVPILAIPHE